MDNQFNNELKTFFYNERKVRTTIKNGEVWWILKDICDVLGLTSSARVAERLEKDEVSSTHFIDSIGRSQETLIINESGLYVRSEPQIRGATVVLWRLNSAPPGIGVKVCPTLRKLGNVLGASMG
jgi:hypothetical protein